MSSSFQGSKEFEIGGVHGTLEISITWPERTLWETPEGVAQLLWLDAQMGLLNCERELLEKLRPVDADDTGAGAVEEIDAAHAPAGPAEAPL